jgi:CRISPR/Cas system CSM-associated protein Csm2 small subunit
MTDANNTEDTTKHGRRKSDDPEFKTPVSSTHSNRWSSVFNGLGLAFLLGIAVTAGGVLRQVDSNVDDIDHNKQSIKEILIQNNALLVTLAGQNAQQKESDKRFESMFRDVIDGLDDVDDSVRENKKDIIIMQQKISAVDNTGVIVAMR